MQANINLQTFFGAIFKRSENHKFSKKFATQTLDKNLCHILGKVFIKFNEQVKV